MARGRFISNGIISDKKINELSDDTSRLAFTWLITTADAEGRTHGDPAMVRSILFPRRADVTVERMEAYIAEWAASGLIRWYESNDDLWIDFPNFEKHQTGLRKEREPASQIPQHIDGTDHKVVSEVIRQSSGNLPAQIKISKENAKLRKEEDMHGDKRRAKSDTDHPSRFKEIQQAYETACGYKVNWANGNSKAAKWLSDNGYTGDQVASCYQFMKSDKFWADKPIHLSSIVNNIGESLKAGTRTESTGNPMLDAIARAQKEPGYYGNQS